MSHKKSKKKKAESSLQIPYQGYNQNQQENSSFGEAHDYKYEDNSNARA